MPNTPPNTPPNKPSSPKESALAHARSDKDSGPIALHHTLGKKPNQASPGAHTHDGINAYQLSHTAISDPQNFAFTLSQITDIADQWEIGDLKTSARSSSAGNWLLCDGSAVSRTTYAALFAVIGTTYGTGDGSTTFNLPDMRCRIVIGADGVNFFSLGTTDSHVYATGHRSNSHSHLHSHTISAASMSVANDTTIGGAFKRLNGGETHNHGGNTSSDIGLASTDQSAHAYTVFNFFIKAA